MRAVSVARLLLERTRQRGDGLIVLLRIEVRHAARVLTLWKRGVELDGHVEELRGPREAAGLRLEDTEIKIRTCQAGADAARDSLALVRRQIAVGGNVERQHPRVGLFRYRPLQTVQGTARAARDRLRCVWQTGAPPRQTPALRHASRRWHEAPSRAGSGSCAGARCRFQFPPTPVRTQGRAHAAGTRRRLARG